MAVLVQQAGRELLPALASWYGVTGRERAVLAHLREGIPAKQIARLLEVSVHTVNEHLKAVYRKTGGAGRDELAAVLSR
ncbi:LuxR family transcriptional regulator [Amycolatopsis sp. SID8362]|nr:LuxR family transcriptional regulator [Amycolatopsis sp. SID8362]NED45160.1 helix-turn-helix transcriptional regulator [Amycolatopsis sp. SID8362]